MKVLSFLAFLGAVALAAFYGSQFMPGEWYALLNKPSWNPPSWVFGPVWAALYLLIAIAAWQVWEEKHPLAPRALAWWLAQLVLNAAWSLIFFGLYKPGWALIEMTALLYAITFTIRYFKRIRLSAASLMTPYLVWVAFAWCLNCAIWWLNGGRTTVMSVFP